MVEGGKFHGTLLVVGDDCLINARPEGEGSRDRGNGGGTGRGTHVAPDVQGIGGAILEQALSNIHAMLGLEGGDIGTHAVRCQTRCCYQSGESKTRARSHEGIEDLLHTCGDSGSGRLTAPTTDHGNNNGSRSNGLNTGGIDELYEEANPAEYGVSVDCCGVLPELQRAVTIHGSKVDPKVTVGEGTGEGGLGFGSIDCCGMVLATLGEDSSVATTVSRHKGVDLDLGVGVAGEHSLHIVGREGVGVEVNVEATVSVHKASCVLEHGTECLHLSGVRGVVRIENRGDEFDSGETGGTIVEGTIVLGFKAGEASRTHEICCGVEGVVAVGGEPAFQFDSVLHGSTLAFGLGFLKPFSG